MDQLLPARPQFNVSTVTDTEPRGVVESTDGREWKRVVFGTDGVAAAETETGELIVWDQGQLFEAVFRSMR